MDGNAAERAGDDDTSSWAEETRESKQQRSLPAISHLATDQSLHDKDVHPQDEDDASQVTPEPCEHLSRAIERRVTKYDPMSPLHLPLLPPFPSDLPPLNSLGTSSHISSLI